jgi:hypothetical protein
LLEPILSLQWLLRFLAFGFRSSWLVTFSLDYAGRMFSLNVDMNVPDDMSPCLRRQ